MEGAKRDQTIKIRCTGDLIDAVNVLKDAKKGTTSQADIIHAAVGYYMRHYLRQSSLKVENELWELASRL